MRPRAERPQRRLLRVDVALRALSAQELRRRPGPRAARRVERGGHDHRPLVQRPGGRRVVRPVGLPVRVDRAQLRRDRAGGDRGGGSAGRSRPRPGHERRRDPPALRLARFPRRGVHSRLRHPAPGPAGRGPAAAPDRARRARVRALAGPGLSLARRPEWERRGRHRHDRERRGASRGGGSGRWPRRPGAAPAAFAAHRHLVAHRAHRAGSRRDRGDRLDGRRVHHRRPDAHPLLPHDPRRAHRVRLGRRATGLRRPYPRSRGGRRRRGRRHTRPPRADLSGAGRGAA